jgi:CRP/FNR family transcriptional regulator
VLEKLKKYAIFNSLGKEDLEALGMISRVRNFSSGDIINYENDSVKRVYFLLDGLIKVYKINRFDNEVFLYTMKNAGLITTFDFKGPTMHFANTECMKDSLVLCIDLSPLQHLIARSQTLTLFFYEELFKKLELLRYVISREIVYDGTAKVAYMIANFTDEFNALKKQEVAYMLNIQPETLSRILSKLKREDVIETASDGGVVVKNHDKLTSIFMQ